jgi:hypothetical protein
MIRLAFIQLRASLIIQVDFIIQLCSLLEADFGLQVRRSNRSKAHVAAEKRFAIAEIADVKIDLDQEVEVDSSAPDLVSPVDTREDIQQAQRAAVTFE